MYATSRMATLVPTKRLWLLVALGLPLALVGLAVPGFERVLIAYNLGLLVLYFVTGKVAAKWNAIKVTRQFESVLSVRQQNTVHVMVESSAPIPLVVDVIDAPPLNCNAEGNEFKLRLKPGQSKEHEYTIYPVERGSDSFQGSYVRYAAPFGLAMVQAKLDTESATKVYPNVKAVRDFELLKQRGRLKEVGLRRSRARGLGMEFESLREYNDDDFRFVDWKSTARRGRLVVRNYEQERNQAVIVVLDLGRHMHSHVGEATKLDHSLDAALLLFHAAERAGDMVGLYAFDDAVRAYVAPKRGRAQVAAVLSAAHNLHAEAVQPNYAKAFTYLATKWKRRSLVVVFTDAENEDQAQELAAALGPMRRHHLLLVVRVKDTRLKDLLSLEVKDARSLHHRAASVIYQSDRAKAARVLASAGISNLEAEPQDLPTALVTAFIRIKERALL